MKPEGPLDGRTIVITRSRSQANEFRAALEHLGAEVVELPAIEIRARLSPDLDEAINQLHHYDWLFFTSANAVSIFFERAAALGHRPTALITDGQPQVCAIGPATAQKIRDFGQTVDLVPNVFQAEGVLAEFLALTAGTTSGLKILLPRAAKAREVLPEGLRKAGAEVHLIPVYDTVLPEESGATLPLLLARKPDLVCLTSSSTVHNFVQLAQDKTDFRALLYAAIGPITADTAREYGLRVEVQPKEWTVPAMVQAIVEYFQPPR